MSSEGFSFNGNILETNILNLSVVIGIVVSLGGDALKELLETRKNSILATLSSSEERAKEAKETLARAKANLQAAENLALEILQNAKSTVKTVTAQSRERNTQDIARLEETKKSISESAGRKAKSEVEGALIKLSLERAKTKLDASKDATFHEQVNNSQLVLFNNWSFKAISAF